MKKLIVGITAEGSVNLLQGQLEHFKALGYKTYLLGPLSERSAAFCEKEGCRHLVIDIEREISPLKDLKTLWSIIKIFKAIKPDIINLGTPKVSLLGMIAGFIVGIEKRIYTCRGFRFEHEKGFKRTLLITMEKITSKLAHQVICISPSLKEYATKNNIFEEIKTFVINKGSSNGIDLKRFSKSNINNLAKDEFLKENKVTDKFIYGFVGRLVKDKGIFELLLVFEKLYNQNKNINLLLLGSDITSSNEEKKKLEKYKNHQGIHFLGFKNNIEFYISMFDVLVVPTYREGFGNVLVQAAAMGLPVISTTGTGTVDAVSDGYNGILVPVKSKEKLQDAMEKMMSDEKQRKEYGENGILWAQNFDRQLIWKGLDKIYNQ
jgi:glycosyltransferase involved in cell wall biosynthesis